MASNGSFIARISAGEEDGSKAVRRVLLGAGTVAEAQDELRTMPFERRDSRLRQIGCPPAAKEYFERT